MKRLFSCVLFVALCLSITSTAFAIPVTATTPNKQFFIDSVDAYSYPAKASELFDVTEIIYFLNPNASTGYLSSEKNNNTITLVKSMSELITVAKEHPFAAIVISEAAASLLEDNLLYDLAQKQHIILIKEDSSENESRLFSTYYVDANLKTVTRWSIPSQEINSYSKLLQYANDMKNDLYNVYEVIAGHALAEIPEDNIVCQYSLDGTLLYTNEAYEPINMTRADWDPADNNEVRIYHTVIAGYNTLPIYSSTSANNHLMDAYEGEAVLYTGTTRTVGSYNWYQVRCWKISGSTVSLVQGWAKSWHNNDWYTDQGTGCERLYDYAAMLESPYWTVHSTRGAGFTVRTTTQLYNSAGTQLLTLPANSTVWVTDDEGYAGYGNPHYFSISGYTKNGTYTSCTSTTFVNAGFNTGNPSTYKIHTTTSY